MAGSSQVVKQEGQVVSGRASEQRQQEMELLELLVTQLPYLDDASWNITSAPLTLHPLATTTAFGLGGWRVRFLHRYGPVLSCPVPSCPIPSQHQSCPVTLFIDIQPARAPARLVEASHPRPAHIIGHITHSSLTQNDVGLRLAMGTHHALGSHFVSVR